MTMSFSERILRSNFLIRLQNWEYWPFGIIQIPVIVYWLWLVVKSRSVTFFTASNPGIDMGGMFGESKYDVIKKIPQQYVPKTILIKFPAQFDDVVNQLQQNGFSFPLIFKPELGERGFMVKRINSKQDIVSYLEKIKLNFIVQELVDLPLEFGVFYSRFPEEKNGKVTSVVIKEMLTVTGDGKSKLRELILRKDRAKLQYEKLELTYRQIFNEVIPKDKVIELVSIGNHALGTKFINGNYLINEKLSQAFDRISKQINGFYFGRFDLRCASIEDLYEGKIKILELNGCGAEPAHIYDPTFSVFKAITVLLNHWKSISKIADQNHKRGVAYLSTKEALQFYQKFKSAVKQ